MVKRKVELSLGVIQACGSFRGNGRKRLRLDMRKRFFTQRCWTLNRLPSKVSQPQPDSVQEETGHRPQTHRVSCGVSCAGTGAGLHDPCGSLPARDIPWFCDCVIQGLKVKKVRIHYRNTDAGLVYLLCFFFFFFLLSDLEVYVIKYQLLGLKQKWPCMCESSVIALENVDSKLK